MNQKSAVLLSALFSFTLVASGCPGNGPSDLDAAIDASKAALTAEYDADLVGFDALGFTDDKMAQATPIYGSEDVMLYGESRAVTFGREKLKATTKAQGDFLRTVAVNGVVDGIEDFERSLVVLGRTDQTDPLLNLPLIRFSYIDLGYRVGHILCLSNIRKQLDSEEPLYRTRCDLVNDLGVVSESYPLQALLFSRVQGDLKLFGASFNALLAAVDNVVKLATPTDGSATPDYIKALGDNAAALRKITATKQTQGATFGEKVNQGLQAAGGAIASGASLVVPATTPGLDHAAAALALDTMLEQISTSQAALTEAMAGYVSLAVFPQDSLDGIGAAVGAAAGAIGAAAGSGSQSDLLAATKGMQETQMSFNLQYLLLQASMQRENQMFSSISNNLKTKHETAKNSVNNVR